MKKALAITIFLTFIITLSLAENQTLLTNVRSSILKIQPFRLKFVVQIVSEQTIEDEESGEILCGNAQQVKWTYLKPDLKIFLLNGEKYKYYDQDNEQLTIGDIKNESQHWLWQILLAEKPAHHITCDDKKRKIFVKNEAESLDIEIILSQQLLPEKMIQIDPTGIKLIYYFREYEKNIKVKENDFKLKVPDNVDVIHLQ